MQFKDIIDSLSDEEKNNFEYYSKIRGIQQYEIIFNALNKIDSKLITYKDINSFVRYDKAIKDVLYKYLGTLEEFIKVHIFANYDFKNNAIITKNEYIFFNQLQPLIEQKNVPLNEISKLYKHFALNFKDIVDLLIEFNDSMFDSKELLSIKDLRNDVMHHSPLLFNFDGAEKVKKTEKIISLLIKLLPLDYPKYIAEELNDRTEHTQKNINVKFHSLLLKEF